MVATKYIFYLTTLAAASFVGATYEESEMNVGATYEESEMNGYVTPDPLCPYPSNEITYFPYPWNCSQFYECYEGAKYIMSCPANLFWNNVLDVCDYECNWGNASSIRPTATTPSGTTGGGWTPDPTCPYPSNVITYYPNYSNCNKFYECYQGTKTELTCPSNLFWNDVLKECDYQCVTASTTAAPQPQTTTPGWSPDPLCPYPSDKITYAPHPYDCSYFYECINGNKYLLPCPTGHSWSIKLNACDLTSNVDCSYTSTTGGTTAAPNSCAGHSDGTFLPYPSDCTKFIECVRNAEVIMSCPTGTSWNQAITACDTSSSNC